MKRFAVLLLLAACTAPQPPAAPVPPVPDTCGAGQYRDLIGKDATALEKVLILGMVRVVRPGQAVTLDFQPTRINFAIDASERISAVTCS